MASETGSSSQDSRDALRSLIQKYFIQLTRGCGAEGCSNENCATGSGRSLKPNAAAAIAMALAHGKKSGWLCGSSDRNSVTGRHRTTPMQACASGGGGASTVTLAPSAAEPMDTSEPSDVVRPSNSTDSTASSTLILVTSSNNIVEGDDGIVREAVPQTTPVEPAIGKHVPTVDTQRIAAMIKRTAQVGYKDLTAMIWMVFSSPESLNGSFVLAEEEWSEGHRTAGISVDLAAVRKAYSDLFSLDADSVTNAMVNAMDIYYTQVQWHKSLHGADPLNHVVILFENPLLHSPEFFKAFPKFLQAVSTLSLDRKQALIQWYSYYPIAELQHLVSTLQQLITMRLLESDERREHRKLYAPQADAAIASATKVMMLLFFASLLIVRRSGHMRSHSNQLYSVTARPKPEFMQVEDSEFERLMNRMKVHPANILETQIPLSEFCNEELNNRVSMSLDYQRFMGSLGNGDKFSFLEYPFILSPANKVEKLLRDNRVSMLSERQRTLVHSMLTGVPDLPFLLLRVDREDIIPDALVQLEAISELNPIDLRKQLRVEFRGEEGIDEGGLQKEFFQLIVEKLFDPMYGMFLYDEDSRLHWFNPISFESKGEYRLIGLLLGLAIYNNIILDIHFPMVVYRKLIGCSIVFQDLYSSHPQIARSLQSMLDYSGDPSDFEGTFMASFQVSFSDLFGHVHSHCLKEDGDKIPVTTDNCKEYVDLYTNWLLNDSIATSFDAFQQGFELVMGNSCLADLFTAEEVELLICGSNEWDIDALEESTRYDGFTADHPVIVNFWQIVRGFQVTQKKQLLAFVTGSDRIPLGGLAKLKFIIVKNGPDSDRLPTAHTCFNALMLCEYSSREKLKERLTTAISYAKGFGMI